jgi:hypothetical protein
MCILGALMRFLSALGGALSVLCGDWFVVFEFGAAAALLADCAIWPSAHPEGRFVETCEPPPDLWFTADRVCRVALITRKPPTLIVLLCNVFHARLGSDAAMDCREAPTLIRQAPA